MVPIILLDVNSEDGRRLAPVIIGIVNGTDNTFVNFLEMDAG